MARPNELEAAIAFLRDPVNARRVSTVLGVCGSSARAAGALDDTREAARERARAVIRRYGVDPDTLVSAAMHCRPRGSVSVH